MEERMTEERKKKINKKNMMKEINIRKNEIWID